MALSVPGPVAAYLSEHGHGAAITAVAASGGCISQGRTITTSTGARFFLKTHPGAPPHMFARESEGLAALAAAPGGPRVPRALLAGDDFLLLEHLAPARPRDNDWAALGAQLAHLHQVTSPLFGFEHDNYIGLTPQPNPWAADGHAFFAEHRLRHMGRICAQRGALAAAGQRQLERLASRLAELIPAQPASLLHGDLWSGNIISGPGGEACLIDPAAHYGWAEADLAMLTLFENPPREFFTAYEAVRPLAPAYRDRFDVYNLYHLLNHLGLFGAPYLDAVERVLRRYA